jgi:hypothetical protein
MFLDGGLNSLAGQDINYLIGFGLTAPRGVAWDSDSGEHLISYPGHVAPSNVSQVIALSANMKNEHRVVDLTGIPAPTALTYLPDEHLIAQAERACFPTCAILLYDNSGTLVDQAPLGFNLVALTYAPGIKAFVGRRPAAPRTLLFLSRTGQLVNTVDVSGIGIDAILAVTAFNPSDPSGGQLLLASSGTQHMMYIVDFTGKLLGQFDYKQMLGVVAVQDLATITTGKHAGAFSAVTSDTSEIVVFRLGDEED